MYVKVLSFITLKRCNMSLNIEQQKVKSELDLFVNSNRTGFFGILGPAGTGKTFTVSRVVDNPKKFIFLGATNKVVSVLRKSLEDAGVDLQETKVITIDRFLNFKIEKDHNNRTIISHRLPPIKNIPDVIVIDEISLINNDSFEMLKKLKDKRKFVLIGDDRQIPPVTEDFVRNEEGFKVSKIFTELNYKNYLSIQQRQKEGTALFDLIKGFRDNMHIKFSYENMAIKKSNGVDILHYMINDKELRNILYNSNPIAVCFKNLTCLSFAWLIGSTKTNNKGYRVNELNVGDVVFFDGYYKHDDITFYTSETVKIIEIEDYIEDEVDVGDIKPAIFNYKKIMVQKDDGSFVVIRKGNGYQETLHPVKYRVDRVIDGLKKTIEFSQNIKQKWVLRKKIAELNTMYSDLKNSFASLKKPFSITSHKSQGSTYDDVIIPVYDYWSAMPQDAAQLLYVAMSRAKKRIIFVSKPSNFKDDNNRRPFTELERVGIASTQNFMCNLCSCEILDSRDFDIDHIKPIANGGKNTIDNLQALCKNCHKEKTQNEKYN